MPAPRPWPTTSNRWLGGEPIEARPVGQATRAWMWCRRNPLPAALAGLCALAIVGGLAGVTWKWREAAVARDETESINDFLAQQAARPGLAPVQSPGSQPHRGRAARSHHRPPGRRVRGPARRRGVHPPDARLGLPVARPATTRPSPSSGGRRARFPDPAALTIARPSAT